MLVIFILLQIEEAHTQNSRWGEISLRVPQWPSSLCPVYIRHSVCVCMCVSLSLSSINSMKKRVLPGIYTAANIIQPNYTMMIEQNYSFFFFFFFVVIINQRAYQRNTIFFMLQAFLFMIMKSFRVKKYLHYLDGGPVNARKDFFFFF